MVNLYGIAAMVFAVLGFIGILLPLAGIILSIIALIFAFNSLKQHSTKTVRITFFIAAIGLIFNVLFLGIAIVSAQDVPVQTNNLQTYTLQTVTIGQPPPSCATSYTRNDQSIFIVTTAD